MNGCNATAFEWLRDICFNTNFLEDNRTREGEAGQFLKEEESYHFYLSEDPNSFNENKKYKFHEILGNGSTKRAFSLINENNKIKTKALLLPNSDTKQFSPDYWEGIVDNEVKFANEARKVGLLTLELKKFCHCRKH